jgi:hypothetical protein
MAAHLAVPDPLLPHPRIARATEALQTFRPAASSSFRHCQLDVGREMKLLTELNFLRGKEMARPVPNQSLLPFLPSSGPGGQCPPGTSWPPARPGQPLLPPSLPCHTPSYRAQRCFSLSLFVGCGHRGLCSGTPQASQRPCPRGPAPRGPPPQPCSHTARPATHCFLLSCPNQTSQSSHLTAALPLFCLF